MKTLVFLDDTRDPFKENGKWLVFSPIEQPFNLIWIKSYKKFKKYIINNGLPDAICFDHDLGHNSTHEKTGYDCAKWLVSYCINNNKELPLYNIQSANPIGKKNIDNLLKNYLKYTKKINKYVKPQKLTNT